MSKVFNMVYGGGRGPAASIFVTGLSETDTVTATKGSKMVHGKWVTKTKTVTNSPLIPAMTSDTEPSGVASVTKVYSDNLAYRAFDGDDSTYAYGSTNALPWTLQYEFPQSVSINSFSYRVSTSSGDDNSRTSTHNVEVSLDGSTWETIWSGQTSRGGNNPESGTITLAETKTIKYIRWVNTAVTGSANPSEQVFSLQVYGDVEVQVSGFEISPIREFGTWTVTATDGVHTKTQDVLVDVITEYEIELLYVLWLYRNGDECEDVTGGWIEESVSNYGTFTKNSTSLKLYLYGGGSSLRIKTVNAIDCSVFKSLCFKYTAVSSGTYGNSVNYDLGLLNGVKFSQAQGEVINFDGVTTVDISGGSFTDNVFACVFAGGSVISDNRYLTIEITEVWLE